MDETISRDVQAAAAGDAQAFGRLVTGFQDTVVAIAYGWLGDHQAALDATQETFADAFRRLHQLREPHAFPGWLKRVALKHCDRMTRRRSLPLTSSEATHRPADEDAPDEIAVRDEAAGRIRAAVERLSPEHRTVVALHYLAGMSRRRIAVFLDLPPSTVDHRLRAARARLRKELGTMPDDHRPVADSMMRLRPDDRFTDTVRLFLALRAGHTDAVSQIVARDAAMLESHEDWSMDLVHEGVLPAPAHATPLIRAIERQDAAMIGLLLDAGASVDGACGCTTGESPLWTAVTFGRHDVAGALLARGANPDAPAAAGTTPLHVASMRGDAAMIDLLLEHGADPSRTDSLGRTPAQWRDATETRRAAVRGRDGSSEPLWTGIKALDLFCPIRPGDAIRVASGYGVGLVVLLAEITARLQRRPGCVVVWCGFEQRPMDLQDVRGAIAESGLDVPLLAAPASDGPAAQRGAFENTVALARHRAETTGEDIVLVVLEADGFTADVGAAVASFGSAGHGSVTGIVVDPFVGERDEESWPVRERYAGHIMWDRWRARAGLWPAVSHRSRRFDERDEGRAAEARAALDAFEAGGHRDDQHRARLLHAYLSQGFEIAEPFSAVPSEWVDLARLDQDVARILQGEADAIDPDAIRMGGALQDF